jgi:hypothetical protein
MLLKLSLVKMLIVMSLLGRIWKKVIPKNTELNEKVTMHEVQIVGEKEYIQLNQNYF